MNGEQTALYPQACSPFIVYDLYSLPLIELQFALSFYRFALTASISPDILRQSDKPFPGSFGIYLHNQVHPHI